MKTELRSPGLAAILCLVAGLAQALALAWPGSGEPIWWLQLLALGVLAGLLERTRSWREAAALGWLFATAWLGGTFWWLFISLHTYGGLPAWLAGLAVLVLAAVLALYYDCLRFVCEVSASSPGPEGAAVCRPLAAGRAGKGALVHRLWLGRHRLRSYRRSAGRLCALAGRVWPGALAAWLSMTLPQAWSCGPWQRVAAMAVLVWPSVWQMDRGAAQAGYSVAAGQLQVALLQGNIAQDEKFQPGSGVPLALQWYGEQLRDNTAALVVAPETAIPLLPSQLPEGYQQALLERFARGEQAALLGQPLGSYSQGYTNSALGLKPAQASPWRYDKHHLVPFGEFIPPFFRWFTELMNIPLGDFRRGSVDQASFEWQGQRLALNICYEDLFGEELARRFADPALAPTMFVNLSNIAWFGNTVAIAQHLQITRMRSLEFERPFLRATNTGATAVVDHHGQVRAALPPHTRGVLRAEVQGRSGLTPYARWMSQLGLWPLWLAGLATVGLAWAARHRARRG